MVRIFSNFENSHKKFNKRNEFDFRTALHWAAVRENIEVTKVLVDLGANFIATANTGHTPYDLAVQGGEEEIAEYLKEQIISLIDKKDTFSEDESK